MLTDPYAWLEQSLATIHQADWYRSVQTIQGGSGPIVDLEGGGD
jgi:8-amino-7-oxononanoate synthase